MPIPPALVEADTVNQLIGLIGNFSNCGGISHAGALYLPVTEFNNNNNKKTLQVFKSTDNGVTWAALDHANGPLTIGSYAYYQQFPQTPGTKIYCCYVIPITGVVKLIQFDLVTETWGASSVGVTSGVIATGVRLVLLSSGTQVLVVAYPAVGGHWKIDAYTFAAGVFSAVIPVYDEITPAISLPSIALDNSDRVFIAWSNASAAKTKLAVVSGGALTFGPVDTSNSNQSFSPGIYIPAIDTIQFATTSDPNSGNSIGLMSVTPTNAPVATFIAPIGAANPDIRRLIPLIAIEDANNQFIIWNAAIDDITGEKQIQYSQNIGLSGWGPVQVLWDTITQPLTPPSSAPGDEELQIQAGFSGTSLSMTVALFQTFPIIGAFCGTIYYLDTSSFGPGPITLTFNLHGGAGGLELVTVQPPGGGPPGPILTPTECINQ